MAIPVATALIDGVHVKTYEYEALGAGLPITLTGSATEGPILNWEWSIIATDPDIEGGIPEGSSLAVGVHGDFTNGKATVQNPTITLDAPGGYCFSLRAENAEGWSDPSLDKNGGYQAIVYVKTLWGVKQPPANQKRYQDDLNQGLQRLEDIAAGVTASGAHITILDITNALDTTTSATFVACDAANTAVSFTAPVAGIYRLVLNVAPWVTVADATARFRMAIDKGSSSEQNTPDNINWDVQWSPGESTSRKYKTFFYEFELSEGSHTFGLEWRRTTGTGTLNVSGGGGVLCDATLVTGSGVGGVILDEAYVENASISGTHNNPPDAYTHVAGLDLNFTTNQDEQVMIVLSGSSYLGSSGYANTHTKIYVDGVMKRYAVTCYLQGQYDRGNTTLHYITEPLSAGPHLVEFKFAKWDTVNSNWNLYYSWTTAIQYRGGLVPVESNGTVVTDKPRALNFIGAGVSVTDTDGTADIQLNESISALGDLRVLASDTQANVTINSGTWTKFTPNTPGEFSFTPLVSGVYRVDVNLQWSSTNVAGSGISTFRFRAKFDDGITPVYATGGNTGDGQWAIRASENIYQAPYQQASFVASVELVAGTVYDVTGEAMRVDGLDEIQLDTGNSATHITVQAVTGSGAGGTIVTKDQDTANAVIDADTYVIFPTPNYYELLSVTIDTAEGEWVHADFSGWARTNESLWSHVYVHIQLDGSNQTEVTTRGATQADSQRYNLSHSTMIGPLAAGPHTIRVVTAAHNNADGDYQFESANTSDQAFAQLTVTQFRGGLVPVRKDGEPIVDKPAAWDFVGPNVQIANVGGTAQVNFNGATGRLEDPAYFTNNELSTPTWSAVGSFSLGNAFLCRKAGSRILGVSFRTENTGAHTIRCKVIKASYNGSQWVASSVVGSVDVACSGAGVYEGRFDTPYTLAAGEEISQSFMVMVWETSGTGETRVDPSYLHDAQMFIGDSYMAWNRSNWYVAGEAGAASTFTAAATKTYPVDPIIDHPADPAGFIQPENMPIADNVTGTTYEFVKQGGASATLRVRLSDHQIYTAVAPLTVDLSASGLLGLEASASLTDDTHYYNYAVPSGTAGIFSIVASPNDPDTGPADYPIYRYLGAVTYRTTVGGVRKFHQQGNRFYFADFDEAYINSLIYAAATTPPATSTWWRTADGTQGGINVRAPLSTVIPTTVAGMVYLSAVVDEDSGETGLVIGSGEVEWTISDSFTRGERFITAQGGTDQNRGWVALHNGDFAYGFDAGSGGLDIGLALLGYEDSYLLGAFSSTQAETPTQADTKLPEMGWVSASQINVAAAPGEPTTVRQTLQDGKQRYAISTLSFDFANGVADLGLDEGTEQASTWYYMYLVPTTGLDDLLTVRASDNPPDTGPTGYSNFKYVGAFFNDASSDIRNFLQYGPHMRWVNQAVVQAIADPSHEASYVPVSLASSVPESAALAYIGVKGYSGTGYVVVLWSVDNSTIYREIWISGGSDENYDFDIPVISQQFYQRFNESTGSGNLQWWESRCRGYLDAYLVGDRGGGGGLAAGSGGGGGTQIDATETVTPGGGGVTTLALTSTPAATNTVKLWQDGVLMRRVTGTPSGLNEWYYNSGLNQAEFNDTLSSTWYYLEWEK